jgi:hypothetical protein
MMGGRGARTAADRMTTAARGWLASLDDEQPAQAAWPWEPDGERLRWFYTPTDHGGLPLRDMRPVQQSLAMQLVATGLSRAGYVTVSTIMGLENVLDQLEGWQVDWGRERGRDPQLYWLRVFGEPDGRGPWAWRFGGHHVSLNLLVMDGEVQATTPCFLGADPAESPLLGLHSLRLLAGAEDVARDLVRSLDEAQIQRALLTGVAPVDIVGGNASTSRAWPSGSRRCTAAPRRRRGCGRRTTRSSGSPPGRRGWPRPTSRRCSRSSCARCSACTSGVCRTSSPSGRRSSSPGSGWARSTSPGPAAPSGTERHYYRLQGPRLLVEYDNTQRDVNHVHTVWRDPEGDFGFDALRLHLQTAHR